MIGITLFFLFSVGILACDLDFMWKMTLFGLVGAVYGAVIIIEDDKEKEERGA